MDHNHRAGCNSAREALGLPHFNRQQNQHQTPASQVHHRYASLGELLWGTQHYHVENTPRSALTPFESDLLENAYRTVRHALTGNATGKEPMLITATQMAGDDVSSKDTHIQPSQARVWTPWPPKTAAAVFLCPCAAWNFEFIRLVFGRSQTPLEARACAALVAEFALQFAAKHPPAVVPSRSSSLGVERSSRVRSAAGSNQESVQHHIVLCALDDINLLAQCIKTLHGLWLGAVHMRLRQIRGGGVQDATRRCVTPASQQHVGFVVDDVYDALLDIAESSRASNRIETVERAVSIRKIVASLQAYDLVSSTVAPKRGGQDALQDDTTDDDVEQDDAATSGSTTVVVALSRVARELVTSDLFCRSEGVDDAGRQKRLGQNTSSFDGSCAPPLEGCEFLPWACGPLLPRPTSPHASSGDAERVDFLAMLNQSKQDSSCARDAGTISPPMSATSLTPVPLSNTSPHQTSLKLPNASFRLPPSALAGRSSPFPSDVTMLSPSGGAGSALPTFYQSTSTPSAIVEHVLLREIDVPMCPRARWLPEDFAHDAHARGSTPDDAPLPSAMCTSRRSRLSLQQHQQTAGRYGHHHHGSTTGGLQHWHQGEGGSLTPQLDGTASAASGMVTSRMEAAKFKPPLAASPYHNQKPNRLSPLSVQAANARPSSKATRCSPIEALHQHQSSSIISQTTRPISVSQHHALQTPEFTHFRSTIQRVRVTQFR